MLVTLSLFRLLKKVWRYLLVLLRLKPANYASSAELAWGDAQQPFGADVLGPGNGGVSWPSVVFWVVALGGPWLIYKCIDQMVRKVEEKRQWAIGTGAHYRAQALYDFQASSEQEISVMAGEMLRVAPKDEQPRVRGWLLASSQDGTRIGMVPINYVKVVGRQTESPPLVATNDPLGKFEDSFKT